MTLNFLRKLKRAYANILKIIDLDEISKNIFETTFLCGTPQKN